MTYYETVKASKSRRKGWLKVGQQVRIIGDKFSGKFGTITKVDKRFKRAYSVKVQLGKKRTTMGYYRDDELKIARF